MTTTFTWQRAADEFGSEFVVLDDDPATGLVARGRAMGADPVPYAMTYELRTDPAWNTTSIRVTTEGEGWQRGLSLERRPDGWRVRGSEQGTLAAPTAGAEDVDVLVNAIDVDLGFSPLTNTLPVRRLNLLTQPAGTTYDLTMAWIGVPGLYVIADAQEYTALGGDRVGFRSGDFTTELELDSHGYVVNYPGLARAL